MRLARRKAKRTGISLDVALENFGSYKEKFTKLPYIRFKSLSSERRYRLMIARLETEKDHSANNFTTYGLGHNSFVPLF